jgi:hypothetical protein
MEGAAQSAAPPAPPGFGARQLKLLGRMLHLAREVTGDHYQLSQEQGNKLPLEVRTLADLQQFEIHSGEVLAYIARYGYRDPKFGRPRDLYQVNLQDHNIIESLRRGSSGISFSPLLLYVLTHELLHVIRFVKYITPFHQSEIDRIREEQRVHALTRQLLARMPVSGMDRVLDKYAHLAERG